MTENHGVVYASILERKESQHILGIFFSKEKAASKCLEEPSYSRSGWKRNSSDDSWDNGLGLRIFIKKFTIE